MKIITCPCCKKEIKHNDKGIPVEVKYEIRCPCCKALIMIKKLDKDS